MKKKKSAKLPVRKTVKRSLRKTAKRVLKPSVRVAKQKFKSGDFVYSPLNPTEKRQICDVKQLRTGTKGFQYKLTLSDSKGRPKKSGWVNERSLSRRK